MTSSVTTCYAIVPVVKNNPGLDSLLNGNAFLQSFHSVFFIRSSLLLL